MTKILGLDLGTNSIGWAVVESENNTSFELLNKGVRIFQEGVKIEKGIEGSKAAERTRYRSARRIKFRRKLRKFKTLKVLSENGMCPIPMDELLRWRKHKDVETGHQTTFKMYPISPAFIDWQRTKDEKDGSKIKNPYYYRSLTANQKLDWSNQEDRYKIGRAFYHIAQRRGFLSNRLDGNSDDRMDAIRQELLTKIDEVYVDVAELKLTLSFTFNDDEQEPKIKSLKRQINAICEKHDQMNLAKEDVVNLLNKRENKGKVKQAIDELSEKIEQVGSKTLGEYFYTLYKKGEKIRDQYTHREEHYLHEVNTICKMQQLPSGIVSSINKAIFYQRPLKSQKGLVGKCPFEKKKTRCAVSHPSFEEYRMLCFVNNIKIQTPEDEKLRPLNDDERARIIPRFYLKKDNFDFEDLAKQLAPKKQCKFHKDGTKAPGDFLFNYSMHTTVSGCPVSARLLSIFGNGWKELKIEYVREKDKKISNIDIDDVWHVLITSDSDQKLVDFARNRLHLGEEKIKEFIKIKVKHDYAALSLKAIRKILPYLQEGLIYSHAVFLAKMEDIIPVKIWADKSNQKFIRDEIHQIILTQNEEKQIAEIVNGMIKNCHENHWTWSKESETGHYNDLMLRINTYFGKNKWASFTPEIQNRVIESGFTLFKKHLGDSSFVKPSRIDERVKAFLIDNFDLESEKLDLMYHPSALDVFKPPIKGDDGKEYLGSPMVTSIRNPMAMRSLHQLRKLINELIKEEIIDRSTKVNIEMARDLKNANERKALLAWQRDREKIHKEYAERIKEYFEKESWNMVPSQSDVLKYQLWEEQNHICLYTGANIAISDFLGKDPRFDIEHTIPRSQSFDNSQENKTLCDNRFNRQVKKNKIPQDLSNIEEVLSRIVHWKERFIILEKQIEMLVRKSKGATTKELKDKAIENRHRLTFERDYYKNKYRRFTMKDVPEGFKNSQLVDTGIITKYSRLYLKTLFDRVYTVKGNTVADFRKIWGLQDEYEKKARGNHIHHCIDAITIACITKQNYEALAKYYHEIEDQNDRGIASKPKVDKPWPFFSKDLKEIENQLLVSHHTPDVLPKQSKKKLRKRGKIQRNLKGETKYQQGDTIRGSLHQETFYGAILRPKKDNKGKHVYDLNGELDFETNSNGDKVFYVTRKNVEDIKKGDVDKIVDEAVKKIIIDAIKNKLIVITPENQKNKINETVWMNKEKGIKINKVRCLHTLKNPLKIKEHRDTSKKKHKQHYYTGNDKNYLMAIYEGINSKGKIDRDYKIINNMEDGEFFKSSVYKNLKSQGLNQLETSLLSHEKDSYKIYQIIKPGKMALLWKHFPSEIWELDEVQLKNRLYKIRGVDKDGIKLYYHQEARPGTELIKYMNEIIRKGFVDEGILDTKKVMDMLKETGSPIDNQKDISPYAEKSVNGQWLIKDKLGSVILSLNDIENLIKESKLTTPKGGDIVDKGVDFPYVKFKPSNFNALLEGVDFKISALGIITKLK
ncbi:MAG: type II CRISPR RNA-guided endonuclease Cas9 [Cyclobacteriaceae bacterium]|nr:type II CRISPR RNA-guided endonuclease Cas9 [Cyclobacteriaceae bacterium]